MSRNSAENQMSGLEWAVSTTICGVLPGAIIGGISGYLLKDANIGIAVATATTVGVGIFVRWLVQGFFHQKNINI